LSAAAGENYTPPGNPNWDALKQTLDKELPQEKDKRRRGLFWFFLLPAMFIAGAGYWFTRPAGNPKAPVAVTSKATSSETTPSSNPKTTDALTPGAAANIHPDERPLLPAPRSTNSANKNATIKNANNTNDAKKTKYVNKNDVSTTTKRLADRKVTDIAYQPSRAAGNNEKQSISGPVAKKRNTNKNANNTNKANNGITDKTSLARNNRPGSNQPPVNTGNDKTGDIIDQDNDKATGKDQVVVTQKEAPPVTTAPGSALPPPADTAANKPAVKPVTAKTDSTPPPPAKKKSEKAFSIGVTGGVDMSTVKFEYSSKAGYNIGVLAGYQFDKHWSVYTGAIYTKKNYKLEGDSYHSPAGTWPANYKIDEVDGNCSMWELPIIGHYTFNSGTSSRFFVGAGISSYLMNREFYSYTYKWAGVTSTRDWTNDKSSQFWFSVLDFSVGLEKPLGRHIIGQVEPYAKLPLSGLGTGKIMLSSFGVNVTLQYRKKIGK